ncbi:hypothetical protein [Runella sp.]|jgi:hypothetical protein|uniref:hypothetical protein n=1 Tax=Runella sp. TaxID=1960881 RepID=UPI00301617E7
MKPFRILLFGVLSSGLFYDASAQKADAIISSYTGANASGYLQPLADVLTSTLGVGQVSYKSQK